MKRMRILCPNLYQPIMVCTKQCAVKDIWPSLLICRPFRKLLNRVTGFIRLSVSFFADTKLIIS